MSRVLPDGTLLKNQLLASLPDDLFARIARDLRLVKIQVGDVVIEHGVPVRDVYFPNGGVFSVTSEMKNGDLVEVANVGIEGMLGVSVFLGDPVGTGRSLLQVPDGIVPVMPVRRFLDFTALPGPFRDAISRYAQAYLLQVMQSVACNALHRIEQRCCRWLLETHDRIEGDEFLLKHEYLAIMLGSHRPTVTLVLGALQRAGLITTKYGRIRILNRANLEAASCECYAAIRDQFTRLHV